MKNDCGIFFSLIVPTIGRTDQLQLLLRSMERSTFKSFEVIVVDQNQDNRIDEICELSRKILNLRHLKVDFKGAARARNYGSKFANGLYINFPDDDCELLENLLNDVYLTITKKKLLVLNGMCVDKYNNIGSTKFHMDEKFIGLHNMWGRCIEATSFFEKQIFIEIGGYDEAFGVGSIYGGDEAPELMIRLIKKLPPQTIFYSYKIKFFHPLKAVNYADSDLQRSYSFARGGGALFAKWSIFFMYLHAANIIARSLLALILFKGNKRKFYWYRIKGFLDGYKEYKSSNKNKLLFFVSL